VAWFGSSRSRAPQRISCVICVVDPRDALSSQDDTSGARRMVLSTSSRPCSLVVDVIHRPQAQHVCVLLFCTLFRSGGWLQLRIEVVMRRRFPRLCTVCGELVVAYNMHELGWCVPSGLVASLGLLALLLYGTIPLLCQGILVQAFSGSLLTLQCHSPSLLLGSDCDVCQYSQRSFRKCAGQVWWS